VIATEWKEFKEIDWAEVYKHMKKPAFVFDGRLIVDAPALTKIGFKVRLPPFSSCGPAADPPSPT
jgi:UDPglucose 6-dehydrogenase